MGVGSLRTSKRRMKEAFRWERAFTQPSGYVVSRINIQIKETESVDRQKERPTGAILRQKGLRLLYYGRGYLSWLLPMSCQGKHALLVPPLHNSLSPSSSAGVSEATLTGVKAEILQNAPRDLETTASATRKIPGHWGPS